MQFSTELQECISALIVAEVQRCLREHPEMPRQELEGELREAFHELAGTCWAALLSSLGSRYAPSTIPCCCGGQAEYRGRREATTLGVFGRVKYERAYYVCEQCHRGQSPLDKALGLRAGQVSPLLGSLLALAGVQTAFEEGSRLIEKWLQVRVSENTLRHQSESYGQRQTAREEAWQQQSKDEEWLFARRRTLPQGPARLYGGLDGVIIPLAEGWQELKCGCWYEVEEGKAQETMEEAGALRARAISYYCDLNSVEHFRDLVWATGCQRGADRAREIVFVADGASWIWNLVRYHFPQAVQIVDWYHAAAYLTPIAQAAFGEGSAAAQNWLQQARQLLWEGQIEALRQSCAEMSRYRGTAESVDKALSYYGHNQERMRYAELRRRGYQIGSGIVESACKQIGTFRLKRAGARWSEGGARTIAKARAAWLSGQWDELAALPQAA